MAAFDRPESLKASAPESSTFAMAQELFKTFPKILADAGSDSNVASMIGSVAVGSHGSSTAMWDGDDSDVPASAAKNFAANIQPMRMEA